MGWLHGCGERVMPWNPQGPPLGAVSPAQTPVRTLILPALPDLVVQEGRKCA